MGSFLLTMFREKGAVDQPLSMTRVVSFIFALTVCAVLLLLAWEKEQAQWPLAFLGIMTLFAVPLHGLFQGKRGAELAMTLLSRFGMGTPHQSPPESSARAVDGMTG